MAYGMACWQIPARKIYLLKFLMLLSLFYCSHKTIFRFSRKFWSMSCCSSSCCAKSWCRCEMIRIERCRYRVRIGCRQIKSQEDVGCSMSECKGQGGEGWDGSSTQVCVDKGEWMYLGIHKTRTMLGIIKTESRFTFGAVSLSISLGLKINGVWVIVSNSWSYFWVCLKGSKL